MIRKSEPFYVSQNDVYFANRKMVAAQYIFGKTTVSDSGQEASPNA